MKYVILSGLCLLGLYGCDPISNLSPPPETNTTESSVKISKLADNVWLHTSYYEFPGGAVVPSNGLVVADQDGLILVDTAWGEIATQTLVRDLESQTGLSVKRAIITNFHYDRLAGVDWLEDQGVTIFTHPDTPAKSALLGTPIPNTSVKALKQPHSRTSVGPLEVAYPGPAHTDDNLVVYVKDKHILFGGCAVRAQRHTGMGNIVDSNLSTWGQSLNWVRSTYKDSQIVIPCYGHPGNLGLIDHTLELLAKTVNAKTDKPDPKPATP